jgi:hypothetical protein
MDFLKRSEDDYELCLEMGYTAELVARELDTQLCELDPLCEKYQALAWWAKLRLPSEVIEVYEWGN